MKCEECEAFADVKYPETDVLIWVPLAHSQSKIAAFLATSAYTHDLDGDQLIRISVDEADYAALMLQLRGVLTERELSGSKAMSVPKGTTSGFEHLHRVVPLDRLIGMSQGEWLKDLIEEDRFTSFFQPIVHTETQAIYGYEALFRGLEADGSPINAGHIFQTAENAGMLFQVDLAGRRSAVDQAAHQGIGSAMLFINFNPTAIYDPAYCLRTTVSACNDLGLRPEQIVFEVTETEEVEDTNHLRGILAFYRDAGFMIALDDVGSGYSGLNMLADLEPDIIKIDRHLITGIESNPFKQNIVEHLVLIARRQRIKVLAEGIETEAEQAFLAGLEIDYMQGFLFGKPSKELTRAT